MVIRQRDKLKKFCFDSSNKIVLNKKDIWLELLSIDCWNFIYHVYFYCYNQLSFYWLSWLKVWKVNITVFCLFSTSNKTVSFFINVVEFKAKNRNKPGKVAIWRNCFVYVFLASELQKKKIEKKPKIFLNSDRTI